MAEFPVLPLFTDAMVSDTHHLSTIEFGAYMKLLITAWRSRGCCLPDDDAMLARYTKLTRGQWARIKPIIAPFFTVENGTWKQGRLTDEYEHVRQVRQSQAANGRASALKRKGRHSTEREPSENQPATPSPSPSPTVKGKVAKATSPCTKFDPPPGFSLDQWRDFLINRRTKRLPMTQGAYDGICKSLDRFEREGWTRAYLIQLAVERGWASINTPKENGHGNRHHDGLSKAERASNAVIAELAARADGSDD